MEQVVCKSCGTINDYRVEVKSPHHIGAFCKNCNKWIEWLPHTDPEMFFGKYKGTRLSLFNTPEHISWLRWAKSTPSVWDKFNRNYKQIITALVG